MDYSILKKSQEEILHPSLTTSIKLLIVRFPHQFSFRRCFNTERKSIFFCFVFVFFTDFLLDTSSLHKREGPYFLLLSPPIFFSEILQYIKKLHIFPVLFSPPIFFSILPHYKDKKLPLFPPHRFSFRRCLTTKTRIWSVFVWSTVPKDKEAPLTCYGGSN